MVTLEELSEALVSVFEGERLQAYQDSGGIWTIGIGHTGGVVAGMTCTHDQALQWFADDEAGLLARVRSRPLIEAAALLSFGFNCGAGALTAVLNGVDTVSNPKHTTDRKGNVLAGLVTRRRLEAALIASAVV